MTNIHWKRLTLVGTALALSMVLLACGGSDDPSSGGANTPARISDADQLATSTPIPTSTVVQDSADEPEAKASPTPTVSRDIGAGADLTKSDIADYCERMSGASEGDGDPETWGEGARQMARAHDTLKDATPPEGLKIYHNAALAFTKSSYDFFRSGDANNPYSDEELLSDPAYSELVGSPPSRLPGAGRRNQITVRGFRLLIVAISLTPFP